MKWPVINLPNLLKDEGGGGRSSPQVDEVMRKSEEEERFGHFCNFTVVV